MSGSNSSPPAAADQPLGLTVHGLPDARLDEGQRTRLGRWKLLLVLLVCASPVLASYFAYYVWRPDGRTNYATLIEPSRAMPDLGLRDLQGQPVETASVRGDWLLVVVGPSACDSACEERLFMQRQLREMMGRERDRVHKLWLVLDEGQPAPALVEALRATPDMQVLRASPAAVEGWLQAEAGARLSDHLYIVDPMGQWMMRSPVSPTPAKMKKDLERLLRASSFWHRSTER